MIKNIILLGILFLGNSVNAQENKPKKSHEAHELDKLIAERFQLTYFYGNLLASNIQLLDTAHYGIKFRAGSSFIMHDFKSYSSSHSVSVSPFKRLPLYFYAGQEVSGREEQIHYVRLGSTFHANEIINLDSRFVQLSLGLYYVPEIHGKDPFEVEFNVLTRSRPIRESSWHIFFEGQGIFSIEEQTLLTEIGFGYKHASIVSGLFLFEKKANFEVGIRYAISER